MTSKDTKKVIIIGAGCAGLTAGLYCARSQLNPVIFAGSLKDKGGLLSKTSIVENYPGFPDGILGFDLIDNMEQQTIKQGATVLDRHIVDIDVSNRPFKVIDDLGNIYFTECIIVATGSKPNKLGLHNEDHFWAKGLSSCAVCDGALFKNKKIVVVGGGDSAMEEALFLTKFSSVTLIHRRDKFRASPIMQKRVLENPKIKILYNTVIRELRGTIRDRYQGVKSLKTDDPDFQQIYSESDRNDRLNSIIIENVLTGEKEELLVDGLFYGLGLSPNTELFNNPNCQISLDADGYILRGFTDYETMTSVPGIFAAGDAHDKIYRQAIVACGDGCKAALDVNNYLNEQEKS